MRVVVNGRPTEVGEEATVEAILAALDGLHWATGHYRNGILLAPLTGDLVAAGLAGEALPDWAAAADPRRFARDRAEAAG